MESSSFLTTLANVVNGAKALEDFTGAIVGAAIEDVLLCVARDYGLNYSKMVDEYKDAVLDKHTLAGTGNAKCKGRTLANKPCGKRAVCRGYCRAHSSQQTDNEKNERRAVAYTIKKKTDDPVVNVLKSLDAEIVPSSSYMISKINIKDVMNTI